MSHYGTIVDANAFFASRLFTWDWDMATVENRQKALEHATMLIDQFDYIGQKASIEALGKCPDVEDVKTADLAQALQFPRGADTEVPVEIERACYLIAQALLSGRNPDMDLEAISSKGVSYGGVRTTYDRTEVMEHITHLIPSPEAFNLLRPFFRLRNAFDIKRV